MPNLVDDIPDDAFNAWQDGPPAYSTEDISATYSGRAGDITNGIENASSNGNVAYASTGNYEFSTTVNSAGSGVIGLEGDGSGSTVLYYTGTNLDYFINLITSAKLILRGFTIDITEATGVGDGIPDIGVVNAWLSNGGWADDVQLRGARKRWQDLDADGDVEAVGGYYAWHIDVTSPNAVMFQEGIDLSDGLIYEPASPDTNHFGQGIGFSLEAGDRKHVGLSIFKDCTISDWANTGYYLYNSASGRAVVWNCTARNTSASSVRLGDTDEMVGGYIEEHNPQGDFAHYGLRLEGGNCTATGVEINISDDRTRAIALAGAHSGLLDRVVIDTSGVASAVHPIELAAGSSGGNVQLELRDCEWLDSYFGPASRPAIYANNVDIEASNWGLHSEDNIELYLEDGSTLRHNGTSYPTGYLTNSQIRASDPRPLSDYFFDYGTTGGGGGSTRDYDRTFVVRDIETGERLSGVDIYVYQDRNVT